MTRQKAKDVGGPVASLIASETAWRVSTACSRGQPAVGASGSQGRTVRGPAAADGQRSLVRPRRQREQVHAPAIGLRELDAGFEHRPPAPSSGVVLAAGELLDGVDEDREAARRVADTAGAIDRVPGPGAAAPVRLGRRWS